MIQSITILISTPISTIKRPSILSLKSSKLPCLCMNDVNGSSRHEPVSSGPITRRGVITLWTVSGVILGINVGENNAWAGARRPPPPPPGEKKDPNVNGVLAKVLASKKRKEAMKEAMAKQRERGKKVQE